MRATAPNWLPGILRHEQKKRVQGVRSGILFVLSRKAATSKQVAQQLGLKVNQVEVEISQMRKEGQVQAVTTETVTYNLSGRGRKSHTVKIYRAAR